MMKSRTRSVNDHSFPSFQLFSFVAFFLFETVYLNFTVLMYFYFSFAGIDLCMLRLEMTFKVEKAIHQSMKVMIRPVR